MKTMTEVKFIDFQNDERCKRLERALKLNMIKQINREEKNETYPLPMTPSSISNINMDTFECSSHSNFLQTSKIGSEVVSSSKNLRNMVLKELHTNSYKPIATSSVKRMSMANDSQDDYSLMPPPPTSNVPSTIQTSNNASWCNDVRIQPMTETDIDKDCSKKAKSSSLQTSSGAGKTKKLKVFSEWRVMLNNQHKLIIKGTIHRGIYARSKPIARRLTNNIVESVCQHLYRLEGDLVDKDCDLPDYVRDKFLYGFPSDWLNVCDIWRTFINQGCKITFRWPTSITDSDDDINSEITDLTFVAPNSPENAVSKSLKEFNVSTPNNSNVLQSQAEKQTHSSHVQTLSNSFTQTSISGTSPVSWLHDNKENSQQQENATANCLYSDNEICNIKEKLNLIIDTLANKNSPNGCLHTIGQILDRLHYIILYGSVGANESNMTNSISERNELTVQAASNEQSHSSKEYCSSENIPLQNITEIVKNKSIIADNELTICNDLLQKKNKTVGDANKIKVTNDSDSESEIYAGVRKISVEQLLQHKKLSTQSPKRKGRRNVSHHKSNKEEKEQTSSKSEVKSITGTRKNTQINKINHDDSSISILEDIRDNKYSSHNNYIDRNDKSNVNRRSKSDTIEKQSNSTSLAPIVDNNMYEAQERFRQKKSIFTFNTIENSECIDNEYAKSKNDTVEKSSNRKAIKKYETTNYQCPNCASHELAKNHSKSNVISSVPTVNLVDIMNVGMRSKNRKIIPPLNNWTGERFREKENSSIPCLDNSRVSLMNDLYENPSKSNTVKQQRIQGNNDNGNSNNLSELKNSITSSPEKSNDAKIRKNPEFESNNLEKLQKAKKRQIDQQISDSSTSSDCSGVPVQKRQKINAKRRESSNFNRSGNLENLHKHCSNTGGVKPTLRSMTSSHAKTKQTFHQQSSVGSSDIVYVYCNDIPTIDRVLSTDEDSRI